LDIMIFSMPQLFLDRIPGAPAVLKAAVETAGFTCRTADLSIDFFVNEAGRNINTYDRMSKIFRPSEMIDEESTKAADSWIERNIRKIKELNPRTIGISVFTLYQHRATYLLASAIRKECPDISIILGGMGLNISCSSMSNLINLSKTQILDPFHIFMRKKKLCDEVILGVSGYGGLVEVMERLIGERKAHDINQATAKTTLFRSPIPNYDDYTLEDYIWPETPAVPITGSRGCVRQCTFCDVPGQFGRFSIRTGTDVAEEMLYLSERYNIRKFEFTDSLVNGSLKAFKDWMTVVAEYNDNHPPEKRITWFGQYITRPQKEVPTELYDLMRRSGVVNLVIGVESGSDRILDSMKKKIKVKDVHDELAMFYKHDIKTHFLVFSGFYNETQESFKETLKFAVDCQRYVANGTITKFSVGPPLFINSTTYLYDHAEDLGIELDPYDDTNWRYAENPEYDVITRIFNRIVQQSLTDQLGFPFAGQGISVLHQLNHKLKELESDLEGELNG